MKVILLADVKGHGKKGSLVEASDGYARNYLIPRGLAAEANTDNINTMKQQEKARQEKMEREKAAASDLKTKLDKTSVTLNVKCGTAGKLFGAVTAAEVADAISKTAGFEVDKRKLVIDEPIKAIGNYKIKVKLGYDFVATVSLAVAEAKD